MSTQPPVPLAKSSGVTLADHTAHLQAQADTYFAARPFVCEKYQRLTGQKLADLVRVSIHWHDEGKKHPKWKDACQADFEELQSFNARCQSEYAALGPNPALHYEAFRRSRKPPRGKNLMTVNLRHELASLEYISRSGQTLASSIRAAIAAHHGKLSYRHENRWMQDDPTFEKHWEEFVRLAATLQNSEAEDFDKAILQRYEFAGPRALLQLADHRASAGEDGENLPPFEAFQYTWPEDWTERGVQQIIRELWDEPFAILRAPTGSGKTDAALLWAKHQIEKKRADRLVIAMPTRFTANSLAISTAENLSANGLYHSSAWYQRLKDGKKPTYAEQRLIDKEQELARQLETPVTVTTIDHLCICLTGTREDHHAIFFGLAHSCVVIDEADFYDRFTQANLVVLLRALRLLDVPVLLMSATVPQSSCKLYAQSGFPEPLIHEDKSDTKRIRCAITRAGIMEKPADIAPLLTRALKGEPTIIYANTVRRAQAYYDWFVENGFDEQNLVLYHSRFTEPDKATVETRLRDMLGTEAWKKGKAYGIAILTQIGELSVNISADFMISDLCPLDRLAQRAGRLARFAERGDGKKNVVGELHVLLPYRKNKNGESLFYPAPYGSYKTGTGWIAAEALITSDTLLVEGDYSAEQFVKLVNKLYPTVPVEDSRTRRNRRKLEEAVPLNWLVLPAEKPQEEDDNTENWKSRDIPLQATIYANYEAPSFDVDEDLALRNRRDWREFQLRHGIQIYGYHLEEAIRNSWAEKKTFLIGDEDRRQDKEEAWLVKKQFYDLTTGLNFPVED